MPKDANMARFAAVLYYSYLAKVLAVFTSVKDLKWRNCRVGIPSVLQASCTVWGRCAGIGMACGGGLWLVAFGATVLLIFYQWLFHRNWKIFKPKKNYIVRIVFEQTTDEREQIKQLFETDRYNSLVIDREGDKLIYRAKLYTDIEYSSSQLNDIIEKHPFIHTLEREDDN